MVIIAFNAVMMANAPYTQSRFMIAAQVNIAAIIKNVSAMLRYHWGDELVRCCCCCSSIQNFSTTEDTEKHGGELEQVVLLRFPSLVLVTG